LSWESVWECGWVGADGAKIARLPRIETVLMGPQMYQE
jgi:hypothetical protein